MTKMLPESMWAPLTSAEDCKQWIERLHEEDLLFHFDDDPAEIISTLDGELTFDPLCHHVVRQRVADLFHYLDDPHEIALAVMGHNMED